MIIDSIIEGPKLGRVWTRGFLREATKSQSIPHTVIQAIKECNETVHISTPQQVDEP